MQTTRTFLPMWGIAQQQHRRGSLNAAYTQVTTTGLEEASLAVWEKMHELWKSHPVDQTYLVALDNLTPAVLIQTSRARLAALEELADPAADVAELEARTKLLTALRAGATSRLSRQVKDAIEAVVGEAVDRLQQGLIAAYASAPDQVRVLLEQIRQFLRNIAWLPVDWEPFSRLQKNLKAHHQLQARRSELAASTWEFAGRQLTSQARSEYHRALDTLTASFVEESARRVLGTLESFLDELQGRALDASRKMDAVRTSLTDLHQRAAQQKHFPHGSVILPLKGPSEREVLAALVNRSGSRDLTELASKLLQRWEGSLRELATRHCLWLDATKAPLVDLLRGLDANVLTAAYTHWVSTSAGDQTSVYELIDRHGIDQSAAFLFQRAAPTSHLGGRDIEQLNVSTLEITIVRLPPAMQARDHATRDALLAALQRYAPCLVAESKDQSVTVVRLHAGWPIGLELANRSLLERYVRSGRHGHPPHLLGILSDSPLGTVSGRCGALAHDSVSHPQESHHDP